jgi:hypothetical protein
MSKILTLEISEQTFIAIQKQAKTIGISPELLAINLLEQQFDKTLKIASTEAEKEGARTQFEGHFGTIRINEDLKVDNESIDADLAKEYASNHEDD